MSPRVACAVLAAGASRRLGRPKQLLPFGGVPLVRRIAEEACASRCDAVAVVVGAHAVPVAGAVVGLPVSIVENPGWGEGLASSVRAAAAWAADFDALLLVACDQPALRAVHLNMLLAAYGAGARAVGSAYAGIVGVPALFDATWFDGLRALRGHTGAGALLRGAPDVAEVAWPEGALDVDTEDDVARLAAWSLVPSGHAKPS